MDLDKLLDDSRIILNFSGASFNSNHDVFSYPEQFWMELNATIMMDLVERQRFHREYPGQIYRQKYNHGEPDVKKDLSESDNVEMLCSPFRVGPCSVIDEPAVEFSVMINDTYYNFRTKIKDLETLINKGRKQ